MSAIGFGRTSINPLTGLVELSLGDGVCCLRACGAGVQLRSSFAADVSVSGRKIIDLMSLMMVARAAKSSIQVVLDGDRLVMSSQGIRVNSGVCPDVEFPKVDDKPLRSITLTDIDVEAWAIVDEPTVEQRADDTIWLGICPSNPRLYASASSGPWAGSVRDGQDQSAIPIPSSVLRKIRPRVGDVFAFDSKFLRVTRDSSVYHITVLSKYAAEMYPRIDSIISKTFSRIHLNGYNADRLRSMLSVLLSGADESKLIPVTLYFEDNHLFLICESSRVSTCAAVPAQLVSGENKWRVAIAGETVLATLSNLGKAFDLCVIDGGETAGALIIWNANRVCSIRAGLRDNHQIPDRPQRMALLNQVDQGRALAAEPDFGMMESDSSDLQEPDLEDPEEQEVM